MAEMNRDRPQPVVLVLATRETSGVWTRATSELLGDAGVLAKRLNGSVGVCVLDAPERLVVDFAELAAHGGEIVFHVTHPRLASWSSEAWAAAAAATVSPTCRLILIPGDARGEEVAALLAVRLRTAWIADALTLAVTRTGSLEITAVEPGGKLTRIHRPSGEAAAIVTMRLGVAEARTEASPKPPRIEKILVDLDDVPERTAVERFLPADPRTLDIVQAQRIVAAGKGTGGPDGVDLVHQLADDLGASLAASRMVVDLGWAPADRQVGQTGKTVRPDLYVACGISGASHHLAGMRDSKHIVVLNSDPAAPIHEVAHLSLKGDLRQVIPAIRQALARRQGKAATQPTQAEAAG